MVLRKYWDNAAPKRNGNLFESFLFFKAWAATHEIHFSFLQYSKTKILKMLFFHGSLWVLGNQNWSGEKEWLYDRQFKKVLNLVDFLHHCIKNIIKTFWKSGWKLCLFSENSILLLLQEIFLFHSFSGHCYSYCLFVCLCLDSLFHWILNLSCNLFPPHNSGFNYEQNCSHYVQKGSHKS